MFYDLMSVMMKIVSLIIILINVLVHILSIITFSANMIIVNSYEEAQEMSSDHEACSCGPGNKTSLAPWYTIYFNYQLKEQFVSAG